MAFTTSQRTDQIRTITLNRPEKRNALTKEFMEELGRAFKDAGAEAETRVVILKAAGPTFCAGLDLGELAEPRTTSAFDLAFIEEVLGPLVACPKPTIAMVQGDAIAGGCELALHCDLRVAASDSRFGMPVARIGLAAPYPLTLKLVEIIGPAATKELLFTGEMIGAERAFELRMVNRVVSPDQLEPATQALATTIAANAPMAIGAMKHYVNRAEQTLSTIPSSDLVSMAQRVRESADLREGLQARRERRSPRFRGQ